ncbi:MAG TPA: rhamnulokinase family protein, partial [Limnochordia bacterium]
MSGRYLAIDLGAESGRGMIGWVQDGRLHLEEVHRFPNGPVVVRGHLYWDVLRLFEEIKQAVARAHAAGGGLAGIGIDSWGVDFALLGAGDELIGMPHHYRDPRTEGVMARVQARLGREEIFHRTGIQFMPINTIYQLVALQETAPTLLEASEQLLMIGELFLFWLTGEKVGEFTNATTTQLFDPVGGDWAASLFEALRLPRRIMPRVVPPGTRLGPILGAVADEIGCPPSTPVIAPAVHDTGSAVAAVPATGDDWCYLSSGTWSLLGVEVRAPVLSKEALGFNLTNEGGVGGTFRLLKNIMGLWIIQECRRSWGRGGELASYAELTKEAEAAGPFTALIDPDDPTFLAPGDMPSRIAAFCRRTGQRPPQGRGEIVRCVLESLAFKYRQVIERLETVSGRRIETIHIVGGGSQNELLNRLTADLTGRR